MKILILKPSSLGDVVQALPVLRLIKAQYPHAEVHWWIASALAPLLEGDRDLESVVRFSRDRWAAPKHWYEISQAVRWMRRQRFDYVIDLQSLSRSGAFAWLANGEVTIGLDEVREGARGFYDIAVPRPSYHTHAVDWYLGVLPHLKVPVHTNFDWLPHRARVAASIREKWAISSDEWIALQPGARWLNKRWPAEHFAQLVRLLAKEHPGARFVILGGGEDRPIGDLIFQAAPERSLNLAGQTSLPEMVEWIRLSKFMVTNDTGPMHVAAALKKPVVALFGPTEARRTGPYGQVQQTLRRTDLPCVPCMKSTCHYFMPMECLRSISAEMVADEVRRRLKTMAQSV